MLFGFKYGILIDVDLVFDVCFLLNLYYILYMKLLIGLDEEVFLYVLKFNEIYKFLEKLMDLIIFMLFYYKREGKS